VHLYVIPIRVSDMGKNIILVMIDKAMLKLGLNSGSQLHSSPYII
jgi:hypothetical protein